MRPARGRAAAMSLGWLTAGDERPPPTAAPPDNEPFTGRSAPSPGEEATLRIRARPTLLSVLAEGRIDNETAKRIDQGHVERSETTHWLHVDCQIERVAPGAWREGERQEGMHGGIAKLVEGFSTQDVEHAKRALASPRSNLRLRAIGISKAMDVRSAGRIMALVIPSERSAEGRSQNKIARASWMLRPGPPPLRGIAQTSWRGTSPRSAWQRRLSL